MPRFTVVQKFDKGGMTVKTVSLSGSFEMNRIDNQELCLTDGPVPIQDGFDHSEDSPAEYRLFFETEDQRDSAEKEIIDALAAGKLTVTLEHGIGMPE